MSAPYSMGRNRMGVATVLSTTSGTPCLWATWARASISQMFPAGLPTLSQKTARVLSSISFSIRGGMIGFGETDGDSLALQNVCEQSVSSAVKLRDRYDIAYRVRSGSRSRS